MDSELLHNRPLVNPQCLWITSKTQSNSSWPIKSSTPPWAWACMYVCIAFLCCQPSLAAKEGYTCRPMINTEDRSGQAGSTILGSSIESATKCCLNHQRTIALTNLSKNMVHTTSYLYLFFFAKEFQKKWIEIVYQGVNF